MDVNSQASGKIQKWAVSEPFYGKMEGLTEVNNFYNKGEYKDDKKHNFGIYNGNEGKRYEGFWEIGFQKGLGKYTKKDGSFKIGYWEDSQITLALTDEKEIAVKLREIDVLVEECNTKVQNVLENLRVTFQNYLPNTDIDALLES